tara:strand:+ start:504 stop:674 length:171 start_codon:yes stop_codon:yes gene_type:complete
MSNIQDPMTVAAILQARADELDASGIAADCLLGLAAELLVFGEPAAASEIAFAEAM